MSITVDVAVEGGRVAMPKALAIAAATAALRTGRIPSAWMSITFVSNRTITRLNREHLGRRGSTDVIAFGFESLGPRAPLVGDIYIATDVARRAAWDRGITQREELVRLVVHGTLHVMGHDHPDDESRVASPMWTLQERVVARVLGASRR